MKNFSRKMKKILIIGAGGFIGSYLTKILSTKHYVIPLHKGVINLLDNNSREVNWLGYLEGYDYKGFKFYLLEENNPKFVVKGNKRRYGVAKNKSGIEVLQSNYSFTLSPEILVEELKLQIDQKGLVS